MRTKLHDVAVIVAAKNEEKYIGPCLDSIIEAAKAEAEVYLVDDASTDQTANIAKRYQSKLEIVEGKGKGPGAARNLAVSLCRAEFVCFVDADAVIDEAALWILRQALDSHPKVAGVGGRQLSYPGAGAQELELVRFLDSVAGVSDYVHRDLNPSKVSHNPSCLVMYRKNAFADLGGFTERLWPCEDLELDLRFGDAGWELLYHPEAIIYHARPKSWRGFFKMMWRYGFGHARLVKIRGICQKIHALIFVIPLLLVWIAVLVYFKQAFSLFVSLVFCWAMVCVGFWMKHKGFLLAARFSALLFMSSLNWFFGFVSGWTKGIGVAKS